MELNQAQNQAVEHTGSPLLLVAGPGSGKTRVIIERIVRLVNSGIKVLGQIIEMLLQSFFPSPNFSQSKKHILLKSSNIIRF